MERTKFNWELSRKGKQIVGNKKYFNIHWKNKYVSLQKAKDNATYQNSDKPLKWKGTGNVYISEKTILGRYKIKRIKVW